MVAGEVAFDVSLVDNVKDVKNGRKVIFCVRMYNTGDMDCRNAKIRISSKSLSI